MKAHTLILAAAILSLQSVHAGTTVASDNSKDKLISPTEPAAKKGGLYVGVFGGVNISQDGDSKDINVSDARPRGTGTPAEIATFEKTGAFNPLASPTPVPYPNGANIHSPTFSTSLNSNTGWLGGLKLGYEFNTPCIIKPALEIEAFYNGISTSGDATTSKSIHGLRVGDNDGDEASEPFLNPDAEVGASKVAAHFTDTMNSAVFMFNGIIKFDLGNFRPYVGAGVGLAYVTHSYAPAPLKTDNGPVALLPVNHSASAIANAPAGYLTFGSSDETTLAWQGLAGVDYLLTSRLTVFVEYKALFYLDGPYYRNLLSNSVTAGVKLGF